MYDVIIIGGGPAGSAVAKQAASNGLRTLVVERNKLPRNKSCSGVLIKKSKALIAKYFGEIPAHVTCGPMNTRGIIIENEKGEEYRFEDDGLNIWRDRFDYWLVNMVCASGAELLEDTTVIDIEDNGEYVSLRLKRNNCCETINGRIVVACDGSNGAARSKLAASEYGRVITYQAFFKRHGNYDPRYFYAYLSPEFSEYDAWLNVKDDYAILGVAVKKKSDVEKYFQKFRSYISHKFEFEMEEVLKEEYWTLPVIIPGFPFVLNKGRVFFAGESAGFINPIGEGISCALFSGIALGNAIAGNFSSDLEDQAGNISEAYRMEVLPEMEYVKRQWQLLRIISPGFWDKVQSS